jgi:RNA polymerase sigma-70 factor, ECF subfamily
VDDVLRRLAAGDESVLEALFRDHAQQLYRIAFKYLRCSADAKAAVQDVYVAMWNRRVTLKVRGPISVYLNAAVRNRALTLLRDNIRRREREERWQHQQVDGPTAATSDVEPVRKQTIARVEAAIAQLPVRQRVVLDLRVRRGMTVAEIRDTIEASTDKVVERLYARAVQSLRDRLSL